MDRSCPDCPNNRDDAAPQYQYRVNRSLFTGVDSRSPFAATPHSRQAPSEPAMSAYRQTASDPPLTPDVRWGGAWTANFDPFQTSNRRSNRANRACGYFGEVAKLKTATVIREPNKNHVNSRFYTSITAGSCWNRFCVRRQNLTSASISGTSISTPTTVASAAPEDNPKSIVAVAMATSK